MICRLCGFEFDETRQGGCESCGNCDENKVHCPNCGYGNALAYETDEFKFIQKIKDKLSSK